MDPFMGQDRPMSIPWGEKKSVAKTAERIHIIVVIIDTTETGYHGRESG
jgi:hypothetical protein